MSKKNWISGAVEHPGALREEAHKAGQTTREFAKAHADSPGKLGKRSRLALTLMGLSHHRKSDGKTSTEAPKSEDRIKRRYPTHSKE